MRKIKFRVWLPQMLAMVYDEDIYTEKFKELENKSNDNYPFESDEYYPWHSIYTWINLKNKYEYMIPLQYTGVNDKNGKEIYEGDIVNYFRDGLATVKFQSGCFIIDGKSDRDTFFDLAGEIEVVGNIYENPELLNK